MILKDADLKTMSAKKVRQLIEEKLDVDLTERYILRLLFNGIFCHEFCLTNERKKICKKKMKNLKLIKKNWAGW